MLLTLDDHLETLRQVAEASEVGPAVERAAASHLLSALRVTGHAQAAQELGYAAVALSHLIRGSSREQVLSDLGDSRWVERHQILTRWAWDRAQRKGIEAGQEFNLPFLGRVGPRNGRKRLDREFSTLLRFLMLYRPASRQDLLLANYQGDTNLSPDFDLVDEAGKLLGLEVTELAGAEETYVEEEARERVESAIEASLLHRSVLLTVLTRPSWRDLEGCLGELLPWLQSVLKGEEKSVRQGCKEIFRTRLGGKLPRALGVEIEARHGATDSRVGDLSGDNGSGRPWVGAEVEKRVSGWATKAISKKAKKPAPKTKPCVLVLYENSVLPLVDLRQVRRLVRDRLGPDFKSHFREIWITKEHEAVRLLG